MRHLIQRIQQWFGGSARRIDAGIYSLAYAFIALGGGLYLVQPAPTLLMVMGGELHAVWAAFLSVGCAICAMSWRHRQVAQYVGLPLVITAFALLGFSFLADSRGLVPRPSGFVFLGLAGLMHSQWRRVHRERSNRRQPAAGDSN